MTNGVADDGIDSGIVVPRRARGDEHVHDRVDGVVFPRKRT
ncbi:hypothetical protein ZOD2009_07334 [Haladaptatus paucihalophilus DX253]|uniref:Uncharacterized protein n=1 Tax=Haladaptatus paucihalophilus DX253 TaxID=797209 RepID=E7QRP4_HALPU|nr:hypothetical protein ZOD2009_07334 [Haladaptatus paucihalophilus DX253]